MKYDGSNKVIQDAVHGLIKFPEKEVGLLLRELIDQREFQRLRRIKQLGFSQLTFPGATHTRFAHSIGVMHITNLMLSSLERVLGREYPKEEKTIVLCAALLHDVGHGPFSHAFEKVSGENHEERTIEIIEDDSSQIGKLLKKHNKALPQAISSFIRGGAHKTRSNFKYPSYLSQLVSSQLDADRFDYLLRDSRATGTCYGQFDLDWLISQVNVDESDQRLFLSAKAINAAEQYVFARHHMYWSVYFHKATRSAEVMFKSLLGFIKQKLNKSDCLPNSYGFPMPKYIEQALCKKTTLNEFLELDDNSIWELVKIGRHAKNEIIQKLSKGLLDRDLLKCIEVPEDKIGKMPDLQESIKQSMQKKKLNTKYLLIKDEPKDVPYKTYSPNQENPDTVIYVQQSNGKLCKLESPHVSKAVNTLTELQQRFRYYYPGEIRYEVEKNAKDILK